MLVYKRQCELHQDTRLHGVTKEMTTTTTTTTTATTTTTGTTNAGKAMDESELLKWISTGWRPQSVRSSHAHAQLRSSSRRGKESRKKGARCNVETKKEISTKASRRLCFNIVPPDPLRRRRKRLGRAARALLTTCGENLINSLFPDSPSGLECADCRSLPQLLRFVVVRQLLETFYCVECLVRESLPLIQIICSIPDRLAR